ncbi:uncharacterized protein LOC109714367 isoform X2 [Ananas comosus]|uniref:Uncharacterized protein LOC109714367 isoform X2 n=1 Tax=Ananas comosus TaxID=4615 RepID=A0A6P5FNB2_ANACO|nr:uncharacterized protein LOC109714367 isoform X2 [Ananas comosus]
MADADLAGTLTASPEVHRPPPTPPPQPPSRAPLLAPRENPLDCALRRLEAFLALLSFPSSAAAPRLPLRLILSAAAFVLLGVALPSAAFALSRSAAGGGHRIDGFEITVVVSEAAAAAVSLACVSRGLVKYGIRRFLFVDQQHGQDDRLQKEYLRKIQVSSIVQVVGIVLCLHAATKISHRAQGIASLASRWHALVTCNSSDSTLPRVTNSSGNLEAFPADLLLMDYSESDVESLDNVTVHTNAQLASYMSSYHKREALVLYLLSSPSGITIFGWTVDRTLLNTIFFIEMSLVLFVLGKTIASPTKPVLTDFIRNLHPNKSMHE